MGFAHFLVGLSFTLGMPNMMLYAMCAFIFFYSNSSGCITWLYCSEVSVDSALGLIGMAGYICTFVLSLITLPLMSSAVEEEGTFYMFAGISFASAVWIFFFMRETSTLTTDKEKKELYWPEELKGEVVKLTSVRGSTMI